MFHSNSTNLTVGRCAIWALKQRNQLLDAAMLTDSASRASEPRHIGNGFGGKTAQLLISYL